MSAPAVRTLPIRLDPLRGESFDSWLLAYAARLEMLLSEIGAATALPPGFVHQPPRFIALGHQLGDTEGLAHATGVDRQALDRMWAPLARYNDAVRPRLARSGLVRVVVPLAWSRFCPTCLATNGNRWPAAWRLAWHTTCGTHRCFLVDGCPACGRHQRQHPSVDTATDPRLRCTARTRGRSSSETCGQDLTAEQLPVDADLLSRTTAFEVAVAAAHAPGAPESARDEALDVLSDVLLIARQLDGAASLDPHRSAAPADIGAVLARAWEVYVGKSEEDPARPLIRDAHHPGVLPPGWSAASPSLVAWVLTTRDASLRTTDRLRWRSTTVPRRPTEDGLRNARERARRVPDALWADWAIRLTPRVGVEARSFRMAAAAALLIPGTSQPLAEVFSGTCHDGRARRIAHSLGLIPPGDSRTALGALTHLADSVDLWDCPIDYHRRRDLAASVDLLGDRDWERFCAAAGTPRGGLRKLNFARLWIFETLTGSLLHSAPPAIRPDDERTTAYHAFALRLPAQAAELLDKRARFILARNGIKEPLTWSPPRDWVPIEQLPGPEPEAIDVDHLTRLLRAGRSALAIARSLDISPEHLRLAVRLHPLRKEPTPATASGRNWNRRPFPAELTPRRLRRLVVDEGRRVSWIAAEYGADRGTIMAALARENIPLGPPGRRPTITIDADWLRTEYLDKQRTLAAIGRQLGTAPSNIARVARTHGIPLRSRGGGSHASNLAAPDDTLPFPLAV